MIALLDSDIYAYRAAAACENEDELQAIRSVDSLIINTLMCGVDKCGYVDSWKLFLTGKGNFRNDIAITAPYKGNRADKVKPKHLAALRKHLMHKKEAYYITEAEGLLRLYMQILTGDTADNIIGLRGIGNVKAKKMLEDAADETEMFQRCVESYDGNEDRVVENAHLLFLRRHEGQTWTPPLKIMT